MAEYQDIGIERSGFVATIEIQRAPHNYFDVVLINSIADALEALDRDNTCRTGKVVLRRREFRRWLDAEQGRATAG